jgi:hypothetical protein
MAKDKVISFNVKKEGQFYKVIARTVSGKIFKFRRKTYDGVIYKLDIVPSQFCRVLTAEQKKAKGLPAAANRDTTLHYVAKLRLVSKKATHGKPR